MSTFPGISTGALNWNSVFLFQSSAIAGFVTSEVSANNPPAHKSFRVLFIFFLLHLSFAQVNIQMVVFDFRGVSFFHSRCAVDYLTLFAIWPTLRRFPP